MVSLLVDRLRKEICTFPSNIYISGNTYLNLTCRPFRIAANESIVLAELKAKLTNGHALDTHTHTRTHARTHARTHTHTHTVKNEILDLFNLISLINDHIINSWSYNELVNCL